MKTKHTAIWMLVTIVLIISCKKGNYERDFTPKPTADTCSSNITFSKHISGIVSSKCAASGCHDGANQSPSLLNYSDINSNSARIKSRINDSGSPMPPPGATPLTDCEKAKLNAWINGGAINN